MLAAMRPQRSLSTALLAIVAVFAALTAPLGMARADVRSAPMVAASMPGIVHHDMGGGAPCAAQSCCAICQGLPARSDPTPVILRVRAVEFPSARAEPRRSALLERSTPPPRLL